MNNNKEIIRNIIILLFLLYIINNSFNKKKNINSYKTFIKECNKLKRINTVKILNIGLPYISICLPSYNMEKYLERAIFSIINQSFQNFEIIIVDDNSNDSTEDIIKNMMTKDNRIKVINHDKNLGVFRSRADAINNSKGNYIILMDPDDMLLNEDLFLELYKYNLKYNLDIIEFLVYYKEERKSKIYYYLILYFIIQIQKIIHQSYAELYGIN
jgi:glycosyltransferase involved in cell wall biosynthesis